MHCPNCGISASTDQQYCRGCGLSLPEFSQLLADKFPEEQEELQVKKQKAQRWALALWTGAGIIFYIAFYWAIISEIIIGKGHVLGGILFLLVVTAISVGGLLILYSAALQNRSGIRKQKADTTPELPASPPSGLETSVTDHTTELLEEDVARDQQERALPER